jgi:hypothetical protein
MQESIGLEVAVFDLNGGTVPEDLARGQSGLAYGATQGIAAKPIRRIWEILSGAIATTMPSMRSNRPDIYLPAQARNSSRVMAISGSWIWARAMAEP